MSCGLNSLEPYDRFALFQTKFPGHVVSHRDDIDWSLKSRISNPIRLFLRGRLKDNVHVNKPRLKGNVTRATAETE